MTTDIQTAIADLETRARNAEAQVSQLDGQVRDLIVRNEALEAERIRLSNERDHYMRFATELTTRVRASIGVLHNALTDSLDASRGNGKKPTVNLDSLKRALDEGVASVKPEDDGTAADNERYR